MLHRHPGESLRQDLLSAKLPQLAERHQLRELLRELHSQCAQPQVMVPRLSLPASS